MRRAERRRAERAGQTPRTLQEIDHLLMVDDEARQGALRFAEREGGPFLAHHGVTQIPPLIELPLRGVLATGHTLEACRKELGEVVKEWGLVRGAQGLNVRATGVGNTRRGRCDERD